jgi:thiol-disulfide isomerase/thioredoxin
MRKFELSQLVGPSATHRRPALLLDFGASYCQPCLWELPALQKLYRKVQKRGVLFVLVVVDETKEGVEAMRSLVQKEGTIGFPAVHDSRQQLSHAFAVDELPKLVLLDGNGRVAWAESGYKGSTIAELEAQLTRLLDAAKKISPGS